MLALIAGAVEFVGARLARAVALGQGAGAVRRAAGDLVHIGQSREGIGQADDDHALVQQGRMERGDRRLLAAMLSGSTGEHAADLPHQRALHPEAAGLVEEVAHLGAHIAEARGCAEDDGVVVREFFGLRDWRALVQLHAGFLGDFLRH